MPVPDSRWRSIAPVLGDNHRPDNQAGIDSAPSLLHPTPKVLTLANWATLLRRPDDLLPNHVCYLRQSLHGLR